MSCAIFRTGLRAPHVGDLVPAGGAVSVSPALMFPTDEKEMMAKRAKGNIPLNTSQLGGRGEWRGPGAPGVPQGPGVPPGPSGPKKKIKFGSCWLSVEVMGR